MEPETAKPQAAQPFTPAGSETASKIQAKEHSPASGLGEPPAFPRIGTAAAVGITDQTAGRCGLSSVETRRHLFGVAVLLVGPGSAAAVLYWNAVHAGDAIATIASATTVTPALERVVWLSLAGRAANVAAAAFFGYRALRVAERMFVPLALANVQWLLDAVRVLVGVDTPAEAVFTARKVAEDIAAVAKPVADLSKSLVKTAKAVSGAGSDKK